MAASTQDLMEQCIDDLRFAQASVDEYLKNMDDDDEDDNVLTFRKDIMTLTRKFKDAVALMHSSKGNDCIDTCLKAYEDSLDGRDIPGKFCRQWRKILKNKVSSI